MELEQQVCSLEISQKLFTLGVKQNSLFYWINENDPYIWFKSPAFNYPTQTIKWCFSAFTVAELGELLPDWFDSCKRDGSKNDWICRVFEKNTDKTHHSFDNTEANARAKMLIFLIKNGYIK